MDIFKSDLKWCMHLIRSLFFIFGYIVGCVYIVYLKNLMFAKTVVPWRSRLDRKSSKREVVGSSRTVGKNFAYCNSHFLRMPHSLTKQLQMKSSVTYTQPMPCFYAFVSSVKL